MVLYHVTDTGAIYEIMEKGLACRCGYRSQIIEDYEFKIYFFKKLEKQIKNDLNNWLGLYRYGEKMLLLEVTIPEEMESSREYMSHFHSTNEWEMWCDIPIPPEYIKLIPFPDWDSLPD